MYNKDMDQDKAHAERRWEQAVFAKLDKTTKEFRFRWFWWKSDIISQKVPTFGQEIMNAAISIQKTESCSLQ